MSIKAAAGANGALGLDANWKIFGKISERLKLRRIYLQREDGRIAAKVGYLKW